MKKLLFGLPAAAVVVLLSLLLGGCEKDTVLLSQESKQNEKSVMPIEYRTDSFFNDLHIVDSLGTHMKGDMGDYYSALAIEAFLEVSDNEGLKDSVKHSIGYPCWQCGEIERTTIEGNLILVIPIIDISSIKVEGLFLFEYSNRGVTALYLIDQTFFQENPSNYWSRIPSYFEKKLQNENPNKGDYFMSSVLACQISTATGRCICRSGYVCAGVDDIGDVGNCNQFFCEDSEGGGGDGGSNNDGDDNDNNDDGSGFDPGTDIGNVINWWIGSNWSAWTFAGGGGGLGGSNGGTSFLGPNGFFNLPAFVSLGFEAYEMARLTNLLKEAYDIDIDADQLLDLLQNDCGVNSSIEMKNLIIQAINSTTYDGTEGAFPECLKAIIRQARLNHLEEEDGWTLSEEELLEIYDDYVLYSTGFEAAKKTYLIQYLKGILNFDGDVESWLNSKIFSWSISIYEHLDENGFNSDEVDHVNQVLTLLAEHNEELEFSEEEIQWLLEHPDVAEEISGFLAEYPNGELPIAYVKFVLESRDVWGDVGLDILNPFEEYGNNLAILESETTLPPQEIQNGIEIFTSYLPGNPQTPIGTPFGGSDVNPIGGPDLDFGTDGDLSILTSNNQVKAALPVDKQEEKLKWLFYMATFLDASGEIVADDYLAEFHENEAVFDHYNATLSEMVMNSTNMRNWLKDYGYELNQRLIATEGDIDELIPPSDVFRPALNESHALTILINDTQLTNVYRLDSYNYDEQTGEWDCHFLVNVIDHFGLDDGDVIDFQNHFPGGNGFIAWWALQHRYGWAPFRTDIWFVVHLGGKI